MFTCAATVTKMCWTAILSLASVFSFLSWRWISIVCWQYSLLCYFIKQEVGSDFHIVGFNLEVGGLQSFPAFFKLLSASMYFDISLLTLSLFFISWPLIHSSGYFSVLWELLIKTNVVQSSSSAQNPFYGVKKHTSLSIRTYDLYSKNTTRKYSVFMKYSFSFSQFMKT